MKKVPIASLANAFIWAAAIIAAAILLRGTPQGGQVIVILGGAAGASVIIVGNALRRTGEQATRNSGSDAGVEIEDR